MLFYKKNERYQPFQKFVQFTRYFELCRFEFTGVYCITRFRVEFQLMIALIQIQFWKKRDPVTTWIKSSMVGVTCLSLSCSIRSTHINTQTYVRGVFGLGCNHNGTYPRSCDSLHWFDDVKLLQFCQFSGNGVPKMKRYTSMSLCHRRDRRIYVQPDHFPA